MNRSTALLDANILYSASLRDIFLQLAVTDVFHPRWTTEIHDEWITALLKKDPNRQRSALERTRDQMNEEADDCLVTDYQYLIPSLDLPDFHDNHVLAAAIVGNCDTIITLNIKDFPQTSLEPFEIKAQHPDDFLSHHLNLLPNNFCHVVRTIRARLKNPPYSPEEYLLILKKQGLLKTAMQLESFTALI